MGNRFKFFKRLFCTHPAWEKDTPRTWGLCHAYFYDLWECEDCGKIKQFRFDQPPINIKEKMKCIKHTWFEHPNKKDIVCIDCGVNIMEIPSEYNFMPNTKG